MTAAITPHSSRTVSSVLALRAVHGVDVQWCFTYQGQAMRAVRSAWERSLRCVGIKGFRFHDLRHTWASWHVMSGTSLQELMELGSWNSYAMVLRYAHLAPEHFSSSAKRIERDWGVVETNLRFPYVRLDMRLTRERNSLL